MSRAQEVADVAEKLKKIISEIGRDGGPSPEIMDKGMELCASLPSLETVDTETAAALTTMETASVELWNASVALKTSGKLSIPANAKLRHVAFRTQGLCCRYSQHEASLKRIVMMGLKTGRAWLDAGEANTANTVHEETEKFIGLVQQLLVDKGRGDTGFRGNSGEAEQKARKDLDQDRFTLLCQQIETNVARSRLEDAAQHLMLAKQMLTKFPEEGGYLSMLAFNIGVGLCEKKLFTETFIWLRESFNLGKNQETIESKCQSRTLRLLANMYLESGEDRYIQDALNAVQLANKEQLHPAGCLMKVKILFLQKAPNDAIKLASQELFSVPDTTVDVCIHAIYLAKDSERVELMMWMIEAAMKRFENSPNCGKLLVTNLEVLLQVHMVSEAREFVEYCVNAHHSGQQSLDASTRRRFHVIIWDQAAASYENGQAQEALLWYNCSLSLYSSKVEEEDLNLAKLHRNRANCLLVLQQLDKAKTCVEDSLKCDPSSEHAQYLLFKLALKQDDVETASRSLMDLCELVRKKASDAEGRQKVCELVALAAQQALEAERVETACAGLECLFENSADPEQAVTAVRCLVRLKLSSVDDKLINRLEADSVIHYIDKGYQKLQQLAESKEPSDQNDLGTLVHKEANWFMKIAWNVALQIEDDLEKMKKLYWLCFKLLSLRPENADILSQQVTCALMCAAACLQVARSNTSPTDRKILLEECLEHTSACKQLCDKLEQNSAPRSPQLDTLLLMYEFEARLGLQDPTVEQVLEQALGMAGQELKLFETLAAIAMQQPGNQSVSVRTLKVAIHSHLQQPQPDIPKCSKLYHSLIQLCLTPGTTQGLNGKCVAWNYYTEIIGLLDNKSQGQYPEMEVVWLMTKAWNCGINFYSRQKYTEAEKWCGLSMKLLKYLDTYKTIYQNHMTSVFGDILAKSDKREGTQNMDVLSLPQD